MAKITISRIFEISLISASKAYEEMQPFVDYVNSLADNAIRILRNGITLQDNINCSIISQKFTPSESLTFAVSARPVGVIVLQSDYPVTSLVWSQGSTDRLISATVTSSSPVAFNVKLCVFYA
jgi:hypothetical protein